ncbi:MAG: branched-chain amino acid ABC transporter ATP-binding protein [Chloroflexi bacterium RBG_16_57_11]|nr:MAG: branched-chain amino acid ABC transporter ATP-binding protein [Chloroflexi bacterium RBG_16_57_11]
MLEVNHLQAGYGNLNVLWDVSLNVRQGEFVALIGSNGAGKTTTLRAISGVISPAAGEVRFMNQMITGMAPHRISQQGLSYITEELNLFEGMTVQDNLLLGAYTRRNGRQVRASLEQVFDLFPILKERSAQMAGTLSGGERRMLAIGRGLMSEPDLLMVDEPSLGLAPKMVMNVFQALRALHERGVTLLLVEQNVHNTLQIADKAYVMEQGTVALQGSSAGLLDNEYLKETYLGKR